MYCPIYSGADSAVAIADHKKANMKSYDPNLWRIEYVFKAR